MKRSQKMQESISLKSQKETQQPKSKIELPNKTLVGVRPSKPKEVTRDSKKLPQPTGWRMIVLPFKMDEKTQGGVLITESALERQQVASQCGLVLAMGSQCYKDKERYPNGPWCKVNDWVVFARYAGSRINIEGGEIRLLNDDEILATVQDPKDILHAF
jgi:chaperonin GroES|tara:strand:+ start:350 stop:826 length:477 start_codon:yes stop_codon:yes gene_type:complete